jgi:sugar lactone lactonase YvrE
MLFLFVVSLFLFFGSGQSQTTATTVYGQAGSFTSNTGNNGGVSSSSLQVSTGVTLDSSENLYVCDTGNHRVLFYAKGSTTATKVYGQLGSSTSNTANNGGVSADSLAGPTDVALDSSGGVYIADRGNHRILYYAPGSTTASRVYGQLGSFTSNTQRNGGITATSLYNPSGLILDSSGNLYAADSGNNRVLMYPSGSTTATRVYGQQGMMNTWGFTPITADSLSAPTDVELDASGNLYICDDGNSRVLFYSPATNTTAGRVYGQYGSFTTGDFSNPGGVSKDSLSQPRGVTVVSGNVVYISDTGNYRTLRYPAGSTSATLVYGQLGSLTANTANNGGVSANSLNLPYRTTVGASGDVYIADGGNSRVLKYSSSGTTTTTGSSTTSPAGGGTCFHVSTTITYKNKSYSIDELADGKEAECRIPHIVRSKTGIELEFSCFFDRKVKLILTADHLLQIGTESNLDFVSAEDAQVGQAFPSMTAAGIVQTCILRKKTSLSKTERFFGLNCRESTVYANTIHVSTFGKYHTVPSLWMSTVGYVFGIDKASTWGDAIASLFYKVSQ